MTFANGHALIIGIGAYADASMSAPPTAGDAEAIAAALRDAGVAAYPADQVTLLQNDRAKLADISAAFDKLAATTTSDDTVVIFYAGHGLGGPTGEYYLTAHDSTFLDGATIATGTGLAESSLLEKLEAIKAEKLLLLINACFSGNISALGPDDEADEGTIGAPPSPNLSVRVLGTGEGRAVITACRATQQSWFRKTGATTFFGQAVADGLRGKGASSRAKFVGLFDFYQYVFTATSDTATALKPARSQEPVLNLTQGVGPFPLALAPVVGATALGPDGQTESIQETVPSGTAAEEIPQADIDAVKAVTPGMDMSHAVFNVISIKQVTGDVNFEDVVFGNQTTITIQAAAQPAQAAAVRSTDELRSSIAALRSQLDTLKASIPADRSDAADSIGDVVGELDKASAALDEGKQQRVLDKLDGARGQLVRLGSSVPPAVPLSDTVSVLMQKARSVT